MKKKILALVLGTLLFALSFPVQARQQEKVPRIGFLISSSTAKAAPFIEGFRQGLRELGYIEGKNIILEIRGGGAKRDRLSALATELVDLKVDIIVTGGLAATHAAKEATSTIPIVMRYDRDPVRTGIVTSLAHPGGNITGLASNTQELNGKRFELLMEVVPEARRIAVLAARTDQARYMATRTYKELEAAAQALGARLQVVLAHDPATIDNALLAMKTEHAQALIVIPSKAYIQYREHIIKHAAKNRLPAIYFQPIFVEKGGLVSYGVDFRDEYRRTTVYVDKILKGARPGELPIEQPTKFELVINLKTAKALGLKIPAHLLLEADRVIE